MKKKFLSLILVICLILPIFTLAGCGGGDSTPQYWEILKGEIEFSMPLAYRVNAVKVEYDGTDQDSAWTFETPLQDGDITYFYTVVDKWGDMVATTYYMGIKNGTSTRELRLFEEYGCLNGGETFSAYKIQGDEGHEGESIREVDETYFKSFGVEELDTAYKALNNYIANNWETFTSYIEMDSRGYYYEEPTDEKLNQVLRTMAIENLYICDIAQMNASSTELASLGIDKVAVYRGAGIDESAVFSGVEIGSGLKVIYWKGDKFWSISYDNPLKTEIDKILANNRFAIKGGPSTSDPDYCEYYFDGTNGFRMYTPNNTAYENRTDAYYKKNSDNTYTLYTKQTSDGSWATTSASQSTFDMVTNAVKEQYIPFINASTLANSRLIEHEEIQDDSNTPYIYYSTSAYNTLNGLTYSYTDIKIIAYKYSNSNELYIHSISWKMQFSNNVAQSAVYNMELSTSNINIEYPTAG